MFYLAQICGFIAWISLLLSYYKKNTDRILFVQLISIIFYILNYLFLGAWTGLIIVIFELIRDYLFYKYDKDDLVFYLSIPFYLILCFFVKNNFIEVIPILSSFIEGYTLTKKKNIIISGSILVYIMWIFYDINVKAYSSVLTDLLIVLSNLFVYINLIIGYKQTKEFKVITKVLLNKKIMNIISNLDKESYKTNLLWDDDYQEKIYHKYMTSLIYVKYKKDIIGYINILPLKEIEYLDILSRNEITIKYDELGNNNSKYYIIDSIVLKKKYQNEHSVSLFSKTINKYIKNLNYKYIISFSCNDFEKDVLEKCNFIILKKIDINKNLYIKNI